MKLRNDGKPDKRYKKKEKSLPDGATYRGKTEKEYERAILEENADITQDPNELHTKLLKDNNLKLDFDVLEGTIPTKHGIIKLSKPTLVIKASYYESTK